MPTLSTNTKTKIFLDGIITDTQNCHTKYRKFRKDIHFMDTYLLVDRYSVAMHPQHYQLVHELVTLLDGVPKVRAVLTNLQNNEHYKSAAFYVADMCRFADERHKPQADENAQKLASVISCAMQFRTAEFMSMPEKVLNCLGLLQVQCQVTPLILKLIDELGWIHHITWDRHQYWTSYIPVAQQYRDELVVAMEEEMASDKDEYFEREAKRVRVKFTEYLDSMFAI